MDPIQKLVSQRLRSQAVAAGPHPDPDLLAAFAEKALADSEQAQVLAHLSGCNDCREIVYLALPDAAEAQNVVVPARRHTPFSALRWGTLAAVVAVGAVVFVGTRRHGEMSLYKQKAPEKAPAQTAADLKTPPEVAEIHALRDDRASTRTGAVREQAPNKLIPTPKHMTAKPSAKFDFDQNGQVRFTPSPGGTTERDKLTAQARNLEDLRQLSPAAPKPTTPSAVVGGSLGGLQSQNAPAASGQNVLAPVSLSQSHVGGTVIDPVGAVIPNATVTMAGPIGSRALQSDSEGKFEFDHLTPGSYSFEVQAQGFKTTTLPQVAVLLNKDSNLRVTLEPGAVAEAVEVSAASRATRDAGANASATGQVTVTAAEPTTETETVSAVVANNKQPARKKSTASHASLGKTLSTSVPQWTLSATGAVQRSLDFGKTWQNITVVNGVFRALSAEGTHVWAGGNGGLLYHSADSGQTWTRVTPVFTGRKLTADITRIEFSDSVNGTLSTSTSEIWTTSDGGQSWTVK